MKNIIKGLNLSTPGCGWRFFLYCKILDTESWDIMRVIKFNLYKYKEVFLNEFILYCGIYYVIVKEKKTNPDFCTILTINSAFFIIIRIKKRSTLPPPRTNRCVLNQPDDDDDHLEAAASPAAGWRFLLCVCLASGAEELPVHAHSVSVWNNLVHMQPRMQPRQPRRWQCNLYEEGHVGQSEAWGRKHQWWVINVWTDGEAELLLNMTPGY